METDDGTSGPFDGKSSLLLSVSGYASKLGKVKICVSELPHVGYVSLCFTLGCCMEKT